MCLLHFRLTVDREDDVPVWVVLGRSCGLCWRSWAALRAYVGRLESLLGPMLAILGPLGTYVGGLGPLLGLMLAVLSRSWGLCWRSWVALGAYMGGLGPENAKNMATLKMCLFPQRERDLRPGGRSSVALGADVVGLGPLLGPMLAVLARSWGLCGRSGAEKCQEHGYLENMFISRAGARSAACGSVLSRS